MTPSIRTATAADRPRVIALTNAAFAVEDFLDGTRTDDARFSAMEQKGEFLLAEDEKGRLLGSVYIERRGDHGYLGMLAVDPPVQGKGIGRMLMDAAEQRFRDTGLAEVEIIVLSLRPELLPIYRRLGYEVTGRDEKFKPTRPLKPGFECHGIVMRKAL